MTTAAKERETWDRMAREAGADRAAYMGEEDQATWVWALRECGLPAFGHHLLDLGCGSGRLAWLVAENEGAYGCTVVGVDSSMGMLNSAPDSAGVVYVQNDGRTLPFPHHHFDGGWSVLLFQHIGPPAIHGYLREIRRVLRAGAPFVIQFVIGDQRDPFAYKYDPAWMREAAVGAGLEVTGYSRGLLLEEWGWLTVRRPQ